MSTAVRDLVVELKQSDEDFEFYPTTPEMIATVLEHYENTTHWTRDVNTILDVGAGNGSFLKACAEKWGRADLLAIEKSNRLISELVKFAKVIGTDFHAQSYVDKEVDILFCNPPYSEYEKWCARIIRECPAKGMYFIIPRRWKTNDEVLAALLFRGAEAKIIGEFDFEDAERQARSKVEIIYIQSSVSKDDLFEKFFFERFGHLKNNMEASKKAEQTKQNLARNRLVARDGLVGALVHLYEAEMARIQINYDKAASLDASVLAELGLSVNALVNTLRERLDTLKNTYWTELFQNLDTITDRLTTKNRNKLLNTIGSFKSVDFNAKNIYVVLLWIMEHANEYINSQILSVFDDMVNSANIHNYKSNDKVYGKGKYRYMDDKPTHVSLDFRVVIENRSALVRNQFGKNGTYLADHSQEFISDLLTVANLLGFKCKTDDPRLCEQIYSDSDTWTSGKPQLFKSLDRKDLVEVKAFLNGNLHLRMAQKYTLALNVAVGKLRGWLRNKNDAVEEFGPAAAPFYDTQLRLTTNSFIPLLGNKSA